MGLIAAGAIAGLGKGLVANAEVQVKKDFAALEEAREIRLRQFDAQQRANEQQTGIAASSALEDKRQSGQQALQKSENESRLAANTAEITARSSDAAANRDSQAEQAALDRASREKVASTQASARATPREAKFTTNTIKATRLGAKGIPEEYETLAVTRGGQTFVQLGQFVVPYSAGNPAAPPKARYLEAEKKINKNNAETFLSTVGYLPVSALKFIGQDSAPAPAEEE